MIESPDIEVSAKTYQYRLSGAGGVAPQRRGCVGTRRHIFADIFVGKVQYVSVRRYVVYEIPRLPGFEAARQQEFPRGTTHRRGDQDSQNPQDLCHVAASSACLTKLSGERAVIVVGRTPFE